MLYTHVAAAIASAFIAGYGIWNVQAWRYDSQVAAMQKAHAESMQKAEQDARNREQALSASRQAEEIKYVQEKTKAATAANRARNELDGLRDQLYALSTPKQGAAPATPRGADAGALERELLGQCATTLVGVAAEADRLAAVVLGLQGYVKNVCLAPE